MATWVIGDLHLGHTRLAEARGFDSVGEHDDAIIEGINSVGVKADKLILLGDTTLKNTLTGVGYWLQAIKFQTVECVLGNHDRHRLSGYMQYFNAVYGAYRYADLLLTHIPVHPSELQVAGGRYLANIHAHRHSKPKLDTYYECVSWEAVGGVPKDLQAVNSHYQELYGLCN